MYNCDNKRIAERAGQQMPCKYMLALLGEIQISSHRGTSTSKTCFIEQVAETLCSGICN